MLLHNDKVNVIRGNTGEEVTFKVEGNAKMFRVLSDTIYKNKIGSMVRETACNAVDSHIAAGTPDRPIEIHIPSVLEPWYSVKDFGVGMSHDEVKEVFTTYFKSTKDNSNDMVGAFGLGSKTPFAYTDAFTITSIKDGVRNTYSAFMAESGAPAVAVMDTAETDEPNGVEIMVPVTSNADFLRFKTEVAEQLRFFAVKPIIRNCAGFQFHDPYAKMVFAASDIMLGSTGIGGASIWVTQGGVGYPLDNREVEQAMTDPTDKEMLHTVAAIGAILPFKIGNIEVTASREGISYTKFTLKNIIQRFKDIKPTLVSEIAKMINNLPNSWQKAMKLNESRDIAKLARMAGVTVPGATTVNGHYHFALGDIAKKKVTLDNGNVIMVKDYQIFKYSRNHNYRNNTYTVSRGKEPLEMVMARDEYVFLIRDGGKKPVLKIRNFVNSNPDKSVLVLEPSYAEVFDATLMAKFSAALGGVEILTVSSLPEPPRYAIPTNRTYTKPTGYVYSKGCNRYSTTDWERTTESLEEIDDGGYYVIVDRYSFTMNDSNRLIFDLHDAGLLSKDIYGIRERDFEKLLKDNPEWVAADKYAEEYFNSLANNKLFINAMIAESLSDDSVEEDYTLAAYLPIFEKAVKDGELPESVISGAKRLSKLREKVIERAKKHGYDSFVKKCLSRNATISAMVNKKVEEITTTHDWVKGFYSKYPMVRHIPSRWNNGIRVAYEDDIACVLEYVKMKTGA